MAFTERLRILIDGDSKGATSALGRFRTSISEADGVGGKLKAGWASASESIRANAGMLAVTGGAALAAFGVKALAVFESTAKAAVDMGKATGLSTEEASRWIAVGDDYQVTADSIAGAMGRLGKNMDSAAMAKYGIETRDASGHAKDANTVFLDVLDTINNTDPAERAKVAAELLGKGWQAVAPLLGKTRAEYEDMLGSVEKGQVITDKEAAKAERMRLAQDALSDALKEVTLAAGQMVAEMAPMIEGIAGAVTVMTDLNDRFGTYIDLAKDITNPFDALNMDEDLLALEGGVISNTVAVGAFGDAASDATPDLEGLMDAFGEAHDRARDVGDLSDEFAGLIGLLDVGDAADNVVNDFDDIKVAAQEAWDASVSGSADADKKQREYQGSIRDLKRDVIAFGDEVKGIPKERITEILTAIDEGSYTEAQTLFAKLEEDVTKTVTVYVNGKFSGSLGGGKVGGGILGGMATGGPVGQSGAYLVGEQGPEIVNLPGGSNVIPNSALSGGGGTTTVTNQITVNVPVGADQIAVGRSVADALAAFYRSGGAVVTG